MSQHADTQHADEIAQGKRFAFGRNWEQFLERVDLSRIQSAEVSLQRMLGLERMDGLRFLDVGCGSGLFSLAAYRLGAKVHALDYDPLCVKCAQELRRRFAPDADRQWTIETGSALDAEFLDTLGHFDVVYSWGVLHATGDMYRALELIAGRLREGGQLWIAIYNDQGGWSRRWRLLKRLYNRLPPLLRGPYTVLIMGTRELRLAGIALLRLRPREYVRSWTQYDQQRGMSRWHDMVDWLGGYPFEVARPEEIFRFCRDRGLTLEELTTHGNSIACNEYVFRKTGGRREMRLET
jgi:2-polyprenyl-6-hydroxyphenyl methylase/3-demethylubiquinone-9 3-methyltransferase